MPQKLTSRALIAKRKRDLAAANTRRREKMRAENQRKRRKAVRLKKMVKTLTAKTMTTLKRSLCP